MGKEAGSSSSDPANAGNNSSRQIETQRDERLDQEISTEVSGNELTATEKRGSEEAGNSAGNLSALTVGSAVEVVTDSEKPGSSKQTESVVEPVGLNQTVRVKSKINAAIEKIEVVTAREEFEFKTRKKKRQWKREEDGIAKKKVNVTEESVAEPEQSKVTVPWSVRVASKTPEESSEIDGEEEVMYITSRLND
ncbi:hypothetical protein AOXY_G15106 [Acipenser oxyrinchus oxyrinchus]|uniref:Uncharacterized protein n=1 Tax=Acipenser oxyrinchus oxyrinchus TaxID=40147 RepID=A0AAD8D902_ACIOX|nr:hypothetical protein AOXY_G15106 [Acipenser oxyrinchus oxyrinchus]